MQFSVLKYLISTAEEGSFTRAAEKLHIAQPSLSQSIHSLEAELGVQLFSRSGRSICLTPSGEAYLRWAKTVIASEESVRSHITKIPGGLRIPRIGASPYRSRTLLPDVIKRFHDEHPGCQLNLRDESETDMYDLLDSGGLDLLIDIRPGSGYAYEDLFSEQVLVAVSEGIGLPAYPGEGYPVVRLADLVLSPVVMINSPKGSSPLRLGPLMQEIYRRANAAPLTVCTCSGVELACRLAANGLGYTLVPDAAARSGMFPDLRFYRLEDLSLKRDVCAIRKTDAPENGDAAAFISMLRESRPRR